MIIPVSAGLDSTFRLDVVDVDFELRLYQDGIEVFDAQQGTAPRNHPLSKASSYTLRYNNNDGGPGALHVRVLEVRTQSALRYEINLGAIHSPNVMELQFSLRPDPSVAAPP